MKKIVSVRRVTDLGGLRYQQIFKDETARAAVPSYEDYEDLSNAIRHDLAGYNVVGVFFEPHSETADKFINIIVTVSPDKFVTLTYSYDEFNADFAEFGVDGVAENIEDYIRDEIDARHWA